VPPFPVLIDAAQAVRPRQIAGRVRRLLPTSVLAAGSPPAVRWQPLAAGLGVDPAPQHGTSPPVRPDLWGQGALLARFGAHGFEALAAYCAGERTAEGDASWTALVERWLAEHGRPEPVGWHPYPLSGRVIAWCAALSAGGWPEPLADAMTSSLARQLLMLRRSVEQDVGGNHVLRNATALVIGGACLGDERALRRGARVLEREVPRQLLTDGGHEERSPSYHREVLADLEAAAALLDGPAWAQRLPAMRAWLSSLAAPDGSLPLLNDAWEGPPVTPGNEPLQVVDDLVVLRGEGLHAVLDCAPLGPVHLPAHVHADALSFTLWCDGGWLVADPGAFTYIGPDRDAFRGTAAHATVTVGGRDQCTFWGPFRASLLPRVSRGAVEHRDDGWIVVRASHDGYRPVVHHRAFAFHPEHGLVVADRVEGAGAEVVSRVPLAPGADASAVRPLAGDAERVEGRYAPYLGTAVATVVLQQRPVPGEAFGWAILRPGAQAPELTP
jgi:hypothetical protein